LNKTFLKSVAGSPQDNSQQVTPSLIFSEPLVSCFHSLNIIHYSSW